MMRGVRGHVICNQFDQFQYITSVASLIGTQQHLQALLEKLQMISLGQEVQLQLVTQNLFDQPMRRYNLSTKITFVCGYYRYLRGKNKGFYLDDRGGNIAKNSSRNLYVTSN